jgi:hypothetical protein
VSLIAVEDTPDHGTTLVDVNLYTDDPTGMSSWAGQLVVLAILLTTIVLLARWWIRNRRR